MARLVEAPFYKLEGRGIRCEFRPRQTRQLPRAVDLKGRFLSCQSYYLNRYLHFVFFRL